MKRYMKKIATGLLAATIFAGLAGYASAANSTFKSFSFTSQANTFYSVGASERKTDSSPAVISINSGSVGTSYKVKVMGSRSAVGSSTNCTVFNNNDVSYVVCGKNTYYGIQNVVKENGCSYTYLSVSHGGGYGTVSGKWAPDSAQSFASPSAP